MNGYEVPDNLDLHEEYQQEHKRRHRMLKRLAASEDAAEREDREDE